MENHKNSELHSLYDKKPTLDIIQIMNEYRRRKEDAEEKLKQINQHYDYLRYILVPQRFDDENVQNMTIDGVGRVSLTSGLYAGIKSDMKSAAYEFLSDTGHGDIISNTINAQTLAATIKSMMAKGEEIPEDLFTITPWTRASITKS